MSKPKSFRDLRAFYKEEYRPLYDRFVVEGQVAQELHTEVAAAFDHLMRPDVNSVNEVPDADFERVAGHLKRATFDAFKLILEDIRQKHNRLMDDRYSNVDNGEFHSAITKSWNEAKEISIRARRFENLSDATDLNSWNLAFDEWKKLLPIADHFNKELASKKIVSANEKSRVQKIKSVCWALCLLFLGWLLPKLLDFVFSEIVDFWNNLAFPAS